MRRWGLFAGYVLVLFIGMIESVAKSRWSPVWATVVVILPGAVAFGLGRSLVRRPDDPMAAEKLTKVRMQVVTTTVVCLIAGSWSDRGPWIWLAVLGAMAGSFPARRSLFGESWSFLSYLRFSLSVVLAFLGFWALLAFGPLVVIEHGTFPPIEAGVLTAALMLWLFFASPILRWLVGARRLDRPTLTPLLAAIANRAQVAPPNVFEAGPKGGRWANAFALPHPKRGAVVFGSTLLERLDPTEIGAVFAHEIAHLEQYTPRRLRWLGGIQTMLVFGAGTLAVLGPRVSPGSVALPFGWAALVLVGFLAFTIWHQRLETASDLRAIELGGDAEALVRALTKIYELNHVPRRVSVAEDELGSHPSLARRIRTIRATASDGNRPATDDPTTVDVLPCVVRGATRGVVVVLEPSHVSWLEGCADLENEERNSATRLMERATSVKKIAYEDLHELRLEDTGSGLVLVARDAGGPWGTPIHGGQASDRESVGRLQRAISAIDGGLAGPRDRMRTLSELARSVGGLGLSLAGLFAFSSAAGGFAGLLALLRPSRVASGAAAIVALSLSLLAAACRVEIHATSPISSPLALSLLALASAIALGSDALRRHRAQIEDRRNAFGWTVATLSLTSLHPVLALLGVAVSSAVLGAEQSVPLRALEETVLGQTSLGAAEPWSFLHEAHLVARQSVGSASLFGLAGALLIAGYRRVHRVLGGLLLAAGAALFVLGMDLFHR